MVSKKHKYNQWSQMHCKLQQNNQPYDRISVFQLFCFVINIFLISEFCCGGNNSLNKIYVPINMFFVLYVNLDKSIC